MSESHARPDDRPALLVLGSLPLEEARAFEAHLADCAECRDEVARLRPAAEALAELSPAVDVDPADAADLRRRVLERGRREVPEDDASTQAWQAWSGDENGDVLILGAAEEGWEPTAVEGVESRRLFVDEEADRVTMLVRMAAGASYPAHVHAGPEECLVLEGDLHVGEVVMTKGSFQRKATGSEHPVQFTRGGCVLMITSSLHDELLAS